MYSNVRKYKYLIIAVILLVVTILTYTYWPHSSRSSLETDTQTVLSSIPTPSGWYNWGTSHYPDYATSTVPTSVTFGNQPMNNTGNNTTTLIVMNTQDLSGRTDEEWIVNVLYPTLQNLQSTTSANFWTVSNGKLVFETITKTPAGGFNLNYYVFNNGTVYSFDLAPSYLVPEYRNENLISSPDAQVLQTMVQDFTKDLSK